MIDLMERNREGRRAGNGSGNVSSSRRPRTFGFRDASEDESQNSRFRSKKESHGSRKRKKCRSSNGEYHFGQSEERDENYEDATAMAASDEDDDLPPPTVGRQAGKLKIHLKNTHEELKPVVVPRKLRTAMLKRYNEPTPMSHNDNRRKLNIDFAVAKATTTCSGAALKLAQDMKTNNHKIHSNKQPKVSSSTISEQEAEVAETLFDLARMFSSNSETKSQFNSEMKMGPNPTMSPLSSVQHCSSPVAIMAGSPSSSHNISALGASKRKQHDFSKSKDAGEVVGDAQYTSTAKRCLSASSLAIAAESGDAEQFTDTSPSQTEVCTGPSVEPIAFSMVASVAIFPSTSANASLTNASLTPTQMLQTANCPKIEEKTFQQEEIDNHTFIQKVPSTYNVLESKDSVTNINDAKIEAEKDIKAIGNSVEKDISTKLEAEIGLVQLPLAKNNCPGKSEIDLMAPPKPDDEINDIMNTKKLDIKEKQEVDIDGYKQKDKTMNIQTSEQKNQMTVKIEQDVCKYQESWKANESMKDTSDQSNCLDRLKHDVGKESPRRSGKNVKADSRAQRGDRTATTSMPIAVTGVTGLTLPLSMGLSSWSAGLPPLGYYSPVAAAAAAAAAVAWPSSLSLTGTPPVDENIKLPSPLFLQTRHAWKRSATHVYITHFIESQQQLRKNPLWAAAFAANTYNLSIPMAPGGLLGSALGPEVRGSGLGAGTVNGRGYAMSAVAKDKSSGPYVDDFGRKSLSQQQTQTAQQQLSLFSQTGSSKVFPVTQSASASTVGSDAGRVNVGVGEAMLSNGNSVIFNSSSVHVASVDTENGTSNKGVASAAAVQAQLLHSVIQRNVYPYSFTHQQFGPLFSGHPSPQQVPQYYSNPFFGSHLLQPVTPAQQSQSVSNLMSEPTVTQKQQYSQGCNFAASGPLQQASHIAEASSVDQVSKKECVTVGGIPTAEVKVIPSRSVYSQTSSSVIFPPILAVGMGTFPAESQDISKTLVGKQESKMHQQSQTQLQSQYQATLKWQQQQDINTVNCVTSPAMNLKSPDPYASEAVSPISIVKNQGSDSHPAVTLVMASQGHTFLQTAGDSMTGLVHYQTGTDKSFVSGQSYNFSISEGQKQQQQHRTQRQRLVSIGVEDDKANFEECSFSNGGCKEDRKSSCKLQPNQTNMLRVDLEESLTKKGSGPSTTADSHMNMAAQSFQGAASSYYSVCAPNHQCFQGSKQKIVHQKLASSSSILTAPIMVDSTMVTFSEKTHSYPPTLSTMPQQISSFLGHAVSTSSQGVRWGGTHQEYENFSQRSSAGSPGPATSGCTVPPTIPSTERAPGKMPRNHQSTMNVVPSRLTPDSSVSSSGVKPLSPVSPVPSGAVTAKSALSMKDSLSPKSSSGSNSGKKTSMPFQNVPLKQTVQNQFDIHQHMPYPFFQQPAQPMESVQKQSTVPQQYHFSTNQQQAVQLQKQSLTPQQNIQLRQQLFIQQNPQYFQTQSHQRLEISAQPPTTLSQHAARQMKPQSGQMVCHSQQHGNISQQEMLGVSATSFGNATTGDMPAALCMGISGDFSLTGMSDGVALSRGTAAGSLTPAKLTTDINKSSSCFQKANGTGPTFLPSQCGPLNCVASTQQQINSNCTISSSNLDLSSQATSITDSTQKSGNDKPAISN